MSHLDPDRDYRCCWCPHRAAVPTLRKRHEKTCTNRPEGTDHDRHEAEHHLAPGPADAW